MNEKVASIGIFIFSIPILCILLKNVLAMYGFCNFAISSKKKRIIAIEILHEDLEEIVLEVSEIYEYDMEKKEIRTLKRKDCKIPKKYKQRKNLCAKETTYIYDNPSYNKVKYKIF